jgi:hypothetical protein
MSNITVSVTLFGELVCYGNRTKTGSYATLDVKLPAGSALKDLLDRLLMCTSERGITYINGLISALPYIQPDLDHILQNNDHITLLPVQKIWQIQQRPSSPMTAQMSAALQQVFQPQ